MKTAMKLFAGEIRRMTGNRILPISLVTSFLWIGILALLSREEATTVVPLLIFTDAAIMSVLLVGASHHLERQEGAIRAMMVMPVTIGQIVRSKVLSSLFLGMESAVAVCLGLFIIHGAVLNYGWMALAVTVSCMAHAAIGFSLSLRSRDFSSMLGMLFVYMMLFAVPGVLFALGVIPAGYEWFVLLSPSYAALAQITSAVNAAADIPKKAFGYAYLILLALALLRFDVIPGFKRHAAQG